LTEYAQGDVTLPLAYVLVNTEIGTDDAVLKEITKLNSVVEAHQVYGVYDIVVKVYTESMKTLKEVVTWNIRKISNVKSTFTLIGMN
jgi:DNA-binding Lrp family transcriptional regulator